MAFGFGFGFARNYVSALFSAFTPASLFTDGAPGVWYDPSDLTTLFQDSAGTTPVTAVEQPVGLMLDKSRGLVLGPELVTNGTFDVNVTGWTAGVGVSIARDTSIFTGGGLLVTANVANNSFATQTISGLTVGRMYVLSASVYTPSTNTNNNRATIGTQSSAFTTSGSVAQSTLNTIQTLTIRFFATGTSQAIYMSVVASDFLTWGTAGSLAYFDNISVREIPGNHATQTTSTSRPVLSARYNLLTKTEQFDDAVWTKQSGTTVSSTLVAAPDGSLTAFSVTGNGTSGIFQAVAGSTSLGQTIRAVYLRVTTGTATVGIKDPVLTQGTTTCSLTTAWQRFTLTETTTPSGSFAAGIWVFNIPAAGIEIAWPDVRSTNNGTTQADYQRVNTATDYATTGFLPYLKFDGVDDSLSTNSISFTSTDKMSVFAGVRKLSDASTNCIIEFSASVSANTGTFVLFNDILASQYSFGSKGTISADAFSGGISSPVSNVLTGISDIAGDSVVLRVNGVQAGTSSSDQGTGNFGNYPLYIGRRGGTTLPFNGQLYSMIIVGKAVNAVELTSTETYTAIKTGVTLA